MQDIWPELLHCGVVIMVVSKQTVSLISTLTWGLYAIIIGSLAVYYSYSNNWLWIGEIVAIIGNSAHLVAMHLSKTGLDITAQKQG